MNAPGNTESRVRDAVADLDCLIIGYNDGDFDHYRVMCEQAGPASPEMQIFRKEHVVYDQRPMPWLEAFSRARNEHTGRGDRYHPGEVYNLASIYLSNYLRRSGLTAETVSLYSGESDRIAELLSRCPRVVAITTTFYVNVLPVVPIVELVRSLSPDSHIVVGGPLIDNICQDRVTGGKARGDLVDLLDAMGADSYVREAQGEWTLARLCQALASGAPLAGVPNLLIDQDGDWYATDRIVENNDLDAWSIDWSQFSASSLGSVVQTRTARSCAFKCSFCDYPTRAGALTLAGVRTVRDELRQMAALGVRSVVFVDDTFNVPPKRFKALCQMMIEEDLGLSWYSYFRCSNARDEETFDLAARSGCAGVFLGIESADPGVLAAMRKLAQDDQYRAGLRAFHERDITTFASVIAGFPSETAQSVQRTIEFLNETRPTYWRSQAWWANPRSPIFQERERYGINGSGYTWSHSTMNSQDAAALCDVMFDQVSESTWLPLYDLDFWSLPYLESKGLDRASTVGLMALTQEYMRERDRQSGGAPPDFKPRLTAAVAALDIAPARYQLATRAP